MNFCNHFPLQPLLPVKRGLNVSAKSIDSGQPAQTAWAIMGRIILIDFSYVQGPVDLMIKPFFFTDGYIQ